MVCKWCRDKRINSNLSLVRARSPRRTAFFCRQARLNVKMNELYSKLAVSRIKKALEDSRAAEEYDNQVLKGRAREIFVSDILKPFLTKKFDVCTGHIIDNKNGHSKQIDTIIFDSRIIPPIMLTESEGIIPYEGVLASIEVKTILDNSELKKSIENARSIKVLQPNFEEILKRNNIKHTPACYVFAFRSDLTQKSEQKRLEEQVKKSNSNSTEIKVPISGLCVANRCFLSCADAQTTPPKFETTNHSEDYLNIVDFLISVVNTCNALSSERESLYLDTYLK
jgi:hypothetical protein